MRDRDEKFKYVIFTAGGGYFGLFGTDNAVFRTCLPVKSKQECKERLLGVTEGAEADDGYFKSLQGKVLGYYEGETVDFSDVPVDLSGYGDFTRRVLKACREISAGETLTYGQIAAKAGSPKAARAAGNALANNPVPFIIPCHRVVCSDGKLGGFSGAGGAKTKQKMLDFEQITTFSNIN